MTPGMSLGNMGRNFHLNVLRLMVALLTMVLTALECHPTPLLVHYVFATHTPWLTGTHIWDTHTPNVA